MATYYPYGTTPESQITNEYLNYNYIVNMGVLFDAVYGGRAPQGLTAHDHSQNGGYPLNRTIQSVNFGPVGGLPGVQIQPPNVGLDFTSGHKLVGSFLAVIPGGLSSVKVKTQVLLQGIAGFKTMQLGMEIRPVTAIGYEWQEGPGVFQSASFSTFLASAYVDTEATFSWQGNTAFDEVIDNTVRVTFWLLTNPPASADYRLVSASLMHTYDLLPSVEQFRLYAPMSKIEIIPNEVFEGKPLVSPLTAKVKGVINQLNYALLGASPGLDGNLSRPDTRIPYKQRAYQHQHRGRYVAQPDGSIRHDGALINRPLARACYHSDSGSSGTTMNERPIKGQLIHSAGSTGDPTWRTFAMMVPITAGMRSIRVIFELMPATTKSFGRLDMYAKLTPGPEGGSSTNTIIKRAVSSGIDASETKATGNFLVVPVKPVDGAVGFYTEEAYNQFLPGGLLWSSAAQISANAMPDGFNNSSLSRVSRPVDLILYNPAYDSSDSYISPGPYILSLKFVLYVDFNLTTLASSANSDNPNLLSVIVLPTPGQ